VILSLLKSGEISRMKAIPPITQITLVFLFFFLTFAVTAQEDALLSWAKNMGGSNQETGGGIAVDNTGNVYTTGFFRGTTDFDPGPGTYNLTAEGTGLGAFISKLDVSGNFVWAIELDGTSWERGFGIAVDNAGNVYSTGYFEGTVDFDPGPGTFNLSSSDSGIYILKLDTDGNFVWAKKVSASGSNYGRAIAVDNAQNVYVTGEFKFTVDFDPGPGVSNLTQTGSNGDVFILKLDAAGDFEWAKSHGGSSDDVARSIKADAVGNVYTTGGFHGTLDFDPGAGVFNLTSAGSREGFISKLDINGDFVWAIKIGSTGTDIVQSLALDASGNVYATGEFYQTVDFDPGSGTFNLTAEQSDAFIVKLTSAGNFVWVKNIAGTSLDANYTIDVGTDGSVYTGGRLYGTVDIDTETDIFSREVNGDCIVKLDTDGDFVWAKEYTGTSIEFGLAIAVDSDDNVHVTGQFFRADFDPSACEYELTSTATDIYVLKFTQGAPLPVPTITSFDPPQGSPGTTVVITGTNFDPVPSNNIVSFNGVTAQVVSSTSTSITTTVPPGASDGQIAVIANCVLINSTDDFITGEASNGLIFYNAISADGNSLNEIFRIENIDAQEETSNNTVTIYNRWGDVVFDVSNYDNDERVFTGVSNSGKDLPSGIYYYKLEFSSGLKTKTGYLSLKR
jgi:gliding motility-associated-like protein